jgi:hypothetical protein
MLRPHRIKRINHSSVFWIVNRATINKNREEFAAIETAVDTVG